MNSIDEIVENLNMLNALESIGFAKPDSVRKEFLSILEAVKNKDYDKMEELCRNCSDKTIRDIQYNFDLYKTLYKNDIEDLKDMVLKGADLTVKNEEGNTLLILSVIAHNITFVEFLLNQDNVNTYLNSRNTTGATALAIASELGHNEIIELLRSKGAKYCFI
jgi:ankyrin repeat protein